LWIVPYLLRVHCTFAAGRARRKKARKAFSGRQLGFKETVRVRCRRQTEAAMRILRIQRKKSELGVKRNLFEKAPAYQRGSKNTKHKISEFGTENKPVSFECVDLQVILATVN